MNSEKRPTPIPTRDLTAREEKLKAAKYKITVAKDNHDTRPCHRRKELWDKAISDYKELKSNYRKLEKKLFPKPPVYPKKPNNNPRM